MIKKIWHRIDAWPEVMKVDPMIHTIQDSCIDFHQLVSICQLRSGRCVSGPKAVGVWWCTSWQPFIILKLRLNRSYRVIYSLIRERWSQVPPGDQAKSKRYGNISSPPFHWVRHWSRYLRECTDLDFNTLPSPFLYRDSMRWRVGPLSHGGDNAPPP